MTEWKKRLQVNRQRFSGMLGFAMRAGRVVIGFEQITALLPKKNKIQLVIVSEDASEATRKRLLSKTEFYGVKIIAAQVPAEELGRLLGKSFAPVCVGITDEGFARELILAADTANN